MRKRATYRRRTLLRGLGLAAGTVGLAASRGAAVYVWHCDQEGRYSLCSEGAEDENHLRGVQVADAHGVVATSQLALPEAVCDEVYAEPGYEASVGNLARLGGHGGTPAPPSSG
jgi:hypothetical protein